MTGIITTTSISLSWEKPDGNASSYEIQILGDPTFNKTVTSTSDTIEGLTPGNYYIFLLSAVVGENNVTGNSSAISVYTKPEVVQNLITGIITTTYVSLSWERPDGNASSYEIQILGEPTFEKSVTSTSDTIEGLTPGNYYTFLITAVVGENVTGKSSEITVYTQPEAVKNLIIDIITTTSIFLTWEKPDGNASLYEIQILGDPTHNKTVTTPSDTIEGLIPGNYYMLLVTAAVGEINVKGTSLGIYVYTKPEVVKNLMTGIITTTSISLSWVRPDGNASSYEIQILGEPTFNETVTSTSVTIEGLTPGNYYTLLVTAVVGENNVTGNSSELSVYTKPDLVKNLMTGIITTTSISLSWDKPDGNASSYEIQILGEPTFNKTVTSTSDTIGSLTPGNYYTLLVTAVVGENDVTGASSEIFEYTRPEVVKNLMTGIITTTSISLSWEKPDGNASSYEIQILGNPFFYKTVTSTSDTIEGLTPGNYYTLLVTAVVGDNNVTGNSSEISVYAKPDLVKNLMIGITTTTSISLNWEKPDGNASSYEIQILGDPTFNKTMTTTSYTIESLTPGNYYTLLVSAVVGENNVTGNSSAIFVYTKPEVVKNLMTGVITTTSLSVSWEKPDGNASSYEIQILGEPTVEKFVTLASDVIDGLIPGNYYTLLVTAVVGGNNVTGNSTEISVYTKPEGVKNLMTGVITTTSISLSWAKPDGNASSYEIQILGEPTFNKTVTSTSNIIEGLTPGNYYTLLVTAVVGENNVTGNSTEISVYTKPEGVKNLMAGIITTTSISLSWAKPDGNASSYEIQILGEPTFNKTVTSTSDTIEGLTPGNYYTLLVTAVVGENNVTGNSTEISVYTKPEGVKNLMAGIITTTSISLSWAKPDGNASSYEIQILGEPTFNKTVTSTSDTIEGLTPGNYYTLLVTAVVGENNVTGNIAEISVYTKPQIVKNLMAELITTNSLFLTWEKPDGNASSYEIQILGEPTFNKTVTSISDTIEDLTPGNYYTLLVTTVVVENVVTGTSFEISFNTKPEVVKNLMTGIITTTSISLSWEKPDGNASFYEIQILGEPTFNKTVTLTSDTIEGLTPGNYYTLLVTAVVGEKKVRGNSTEISVYTKPEVAKNLMIGIITTTSISLSWEKPDGNVSSYEIQILGNPTFNKTVISTSDTLEGLTPGNYYTLLVTAVVGENNVTGNSSEISEYTRPATVTKLKASIINSSTIYVSWLLPEGNRSSYLVDVIGDPPQSFIVYSESAIINYLTSGNQYTVRISAEAGNGLLGGSSDILVLGNITATLVTTTSFWLNWDFNIAENTTYSISVYGEPSSTWTVNTTAIQITNLTSGNFYNIQISAYNSYMVLYGYVGQIILYTRPGVVRNVQVTNISINSMTMSWLPPQSNYSHYLIEVTGDIYLNETTTSESLPVSGLTPGNQYTVTIRAVTGADVSGDFTDKIIFTRPEKVKNLIVFSVTDMSVSLSWLPPDGRTSSYLIQIQEDEKYNKITPLTEFTVQDLIPGTWYTFLVSSLTGYDTVQGDNVSTSNYTIPGLVKNLTVDNITTTSVSLNWEIPAGNADSYMIQVLEDPSLNRIVNTTLNTIGGLMPGYFYTFMVFALVGNDMVQGDKNAISTYTEPDIVGNLRTENITTTSISLSWEKLNGNADSYKIQIIEDPSLNRIVTTSFNTIGGLTPGYYYTFMVFALVGNNSVQGKKNTTYIYTKPDVITDLRTLNISTTSITLGWQIPDGNVTFYLIEMAGPVTVYFQTSINESVIKDLMPGNLYSFRVFAVVGEPNVQGNGVDISAYTIPGLVKNLTVDNITTTSVTLNWEIPDGNADSYMIQVLEDPSLNRIVNTTLNTIGGLMPGYFYTFMVFALVGNDMVQGDKNTISTYTEPDIVGNLRTENITTTSISLSWEKLNGNADSYKIQIIEDPSLNRIVTTSFNTIGGLTPGYYYTFMVFALVGNNSVQGKKNTTFTYTKPDVITDLRTLNISTTSITLGWQISDGNVTFYLIEMAGPVTVYFQTSINESVIKDLMPGNLYSFRVFAVVGEPNVQGNGVDISAYTIPGLVKNLTVDNITTTSVTLNWEIPDGNADSYMIQVLEDPSLNRIVNTTLNTIGGLMPGYFYTFMVFALVGNDMVQGDKNTISTYTEPDIVGNLRTDNITTTSISLSWEKLNGNADSYKIQIIEDPSLNRIVTTSFNTIGGLTPGYYYTFMVFALVGNNSVQGKKNTTYTYTKPDAVTDLRTLNISTTSTTLGWQIPDGNVTFYLIEMAGPVAVYFQTYINESVITNLTPGNLYSFQVFAVVGESKVQGNGLDISAYTIPGLVKNLTVDNITTTSVSLNWQKPDGNADSYMIQVLEDPSLNRIVNTTLNTIGGLTPGYYYTFIVFALVGNNSVQGEKSTISTYTKPEVVGNLKTENATTTSVSLSWEKPIGNASSYLIKTVEDPTLSKIVLTTFDTIIGLTSGYYYTFMVYALVENNSVQGERNTTYTYTKPNVVKNLITGIITTTSISVIWEKPDGNASSYEIQILGDPTFNKTVATTSDTIGGLTPGNYYTLMVTAVVGENNVTGSSLEISVNTRPATVTELKVSIINSSTIYVSWLLPEGNRSSYLVEVIGDPPQSFTVLSESVIITNLNIVNQYTLRITAVAGNGVQGGSKELVILGNITATLITTTSFWLNWDSYFGENTTYSISVYGEPSSNWTVNTTAIQITNLTSGNFYNIQISAYNRFLVLYGFVGQISLYTRPGMVGNVQVTNISTNSMTISWLPPHSNYSHYLIEVTGDIYKTRTTTSNSLLFSDLTPGNQYIVTITAVTGADVLGDSTENINFTRPEKVKNLIVFSITDTSASLSWLPPDGRTSSYLIQIQGDEKYKKNTPLTLFTVQDLIPGTQYTFLVSSLTGYDTVQGDNVSTSNYTIPGLVKNLTVDNNTTTSVSLNWQKPDGNADSYMIQVLEDPSFNRIVNTTLNTIGGLTPGYYYTFTVFALVGNNSVQGKKNTIFTYTKPEIVGNLRKLNATTTSVSLSWEKPIGNSSSYLIKIFEDPTFSKIVFTTFDTIGGLTPGYYYTFMVFALVGNNSVQGEKNTMYTYTKPEIVGNLRKLNATTTSVSLSWEKPIGNSSSYLIKIFEDPTFSKIVFTTFDTIGGLTPGYYYTFMVFALVGNNSVQGEKNTTYTYTKPDVVIDLRTLNISTTSITLGWQIPYGNVTFYMIEMAGPVTVYFQTSINESVITNLTPGNLYSFRVFAVVGESKVQGNGLDISAYTRPEVVEDLKLQNISTTSVSLVWKPPIGYVESYRIQIVGNLSFTKNITLPSATLGDLIPGNYYTALVSAVVQGTILGENKNISFNTEPAAVKNLTVEKITTSSFTLNWLPPEGAVSGYLIQISGNVNDTGDTTYKPEHLTPGNVYKVVVSAVVGDSKIQGEGSEIVVKTNANSLIITLKYSSSADKSEVLIIDELNRIIEQQFSGQNVTAVLKQIKKV
ncbi:tenascin-X-like [Ranitomeya variabilis]|uniref:tenascin-X-like n=1 Tax=Ranitomeya variabilis TaxID=490064 RepID=UPI0040573F0A